MVVFNLAILATFDNDSYNATLSYSTPPILSNVPTPTQPFPTPFLPHSPFPNLTYTTLFFSVIPYPYSTLPYQYPTLPIPYTLSHPSITEPTPPTLAYQTPTIFKQTHYPCYSCPSLPYLPSVPNPAFLTKCYQILHNPILAPILMFQPKELIEILRNVVLYPCPTQPCPTLQCPT